MYFVGDVEHKRLHILQDSKTFEIHCINIYLLDIALFHWRCSKTQNRRSRLRRHAHLFVVAALRENAISVFVNTSAARACCTSYLARFALRPESRLMTPPMSYSWCGHCCHSNSSAVHLYTHACRNYIAFARSVFRSFDFLFLLGTSRKSSPCS